MLCQATTIHGRVSSHRQPCRNFFGLEKNIPRHYDVGQLGVEGGIDVNGIGTCIVYSGVMSTEIPNVGSTGTAYIPLRSDGGWSQTQGLLVEPTARLVLRVHLVR